MDWTKIPWTKRRWTKTGRTSCNTCRGLGIKIVNMSAKLISFTCSVQNFGPEMELEFILCDTDLSVISDKLQYPAVMEYLLRGDSNMAVPSMKPFCVALKPVWVAVKIKLYQKVNYCLSDFSGLGGSLMSRNGSETCYDLLRFLTICYDMLRFVTSC